jgi:hypothetical protein
VGCSHDWLAAALKRLDDLLYKFFGIIFDHIWMDQSQKHSLFITRKYVNLEQEITYKLLLKQDAFWFKDNENATLLTFTFAG